MQQIGSFTTPATYPPPVINPTRFLGSVRRETRSQTLSTDDIARAYPEAVAASSDACAWQDIRVVHLRHDIAEMPAPVSEQHCVLVNLGVPLNVKAKVDEHSFDGEVNTGQVAIIRPKRPGAQRPPVRRVAISCCCISVHFLCGTPRLSFDLRTAIWGSSPSSASSRIIYDTLPCLFWKS